MQTASSTSRKTLNAGNKLLQQDDCTATRNTKLEEVQHVMEESCNMKYIGSVKPVTKRRNKKHFKLQKETTLQEDTT